MRPDNTPRPGGPAAKRQPSPEGLGHRWRIPSAVGAALRRDAERFELYGSATQPGFYREQTKTFETQPVEITSGLNNRLQTMPFSFSIPLNQVPPGEYDCEITGKKAALWQAQVKVVP